MKFDQKSAIMKISSIVSFQKKTQLKVGQKN